MTKRIYFYVWILRVWELFLKERTGSVKSFVFWDVTPCSQKSTEVLEEFIASTFRFEE
jgi:hypothetical protein